MTRERLKDARRIVVKLGTHVVTRDGSTLALARVAHIVETLADIQRGGRQVVLVSSGALGLGMTELGLGERPTSLGLRQACAAAGQGRLIGLYRSLFSTFDVRVAQVLLTGDDLGDPDRALCVRTTLLRLLSLGVIPVINENDSVSVRELLEFQGVDEGGQPFGDNDGLSARVAASLDADLLVMLTDVDGMFTANPRTDDSAERVPVVGDPRARLAGLDDGRSQGGTGGMRSKLEAAAVASEGGVDVVIASGHVTQTLGRVLSGDDVGTLVPASERRARRQRRIAQGQAAGALVVNAGAVQALTERKASLLPIGVVKVEGHFDRGALVEVRDESGRVLAHGLANYAAQECAKVAGHHSREIAELLGSRGYDALITRDNLVLGEV